MSTDTDYEIRELLDEIATPGHAPGFWETVRDDLDREAHGGGPVRLEKVRITRRGVRPWMLAAAALALLVGGVGALLAARDDGSSVDMTTEPPETPAPETATTEPPDEDALRPVGAPSRASGQVVAVSPDGRWLYVADADPAGGMGCEGVPRQTLFVQPADGSADGERRLAVDTPIDATGGTWLTFGPDGSVAVRTMCELSNTGLGTGVIADDGTIADYAAVDGAEDFAPIADCDWARPGVLILSTFGLGSEDVPADRDGRRLFEFDLSTGEQEPVGPAGVIYLDVAADGTVATQDNVGTVRFGDEVLGSEGSIRELVVSEDGRLVVTASDKGVTVYDPESGDQERIFDGPAFSLRYLESGEVVFSTRDHRPVGRVMAVRLGDVGSGRHATSTVFSDAGVSDLSYVEVTPDGSRLWLSYLDDTADGELRPVLLSQPLTR